MKPYEILAEYYDRLMSDVDYTRRAEYMLDVLHRNGFDGHGILDLACGTGSISFELARSGFEVIGVDASEEMLALAAAKQPFVGTGAIPPIFLCQDMRELDLYGTIDAAVCVLDGINHITTPGGLATVFKRIALFLEDGGLFAFDVNSPYKIERILGCNTFVYDYDDMYCVWQNSYSPKTKLCRFDLTFFEQGSGDKYSRYDESFYERAYSDKSIKKCLAQAGLEYIAVYDDLTFNEPRGDSERLVYVARRPKREIEV